MRWRCAECRNGNHLTAWAQACTYGPLNKNGELERHDDVADCFIFDDSIQCDLHPGAAIELKVNGRYRSFVRCDTCKGIGRVPRYGYDNHYANKISCRDCHGAGGTWTGTPLPRAELEVR